jgi:hypothetical protein
MTNNKAAVKSFRWETLQAVGNNSAASYANAVNYLQSTPLPYYWSTCSKLGLAAAGAAPSTQQ